MTIAADCQLALPLQETGPGAVSWAGLPGPARATVLVLLARLIARGVLAGLKAATRVEPGQRWSGVTAARRPSC